MNIAIVGPSPVPFAIGGVENLLWGMTTHINQNTKHNCELIKLPSRENNFWDIINSYRNFWKLDLTHFDLVISTKYPAWMVTHKNHICYLQHRLRGLYDTYHFTKLPVKFNHNNNLIKTILDFLDRSSKNPDLEKFFYYMDELYHKRLNLPEDIFRFPHPFIDNAALSQDKIKKFYCISNTVKKRTEYFPEGMTPTVVHHPSFLKKYYCNEFDYLFTISRLDGPKRISLIIEAMRYVHDDINLIVAGKGPDESYLKILAKDDNRIKFIGFINDDEVIDYYSNALAVLYVPYEEDYGLITIEAMMSKKPVITCSDSGGTNEFVSHKISGLIANPSPESIADQINYICKNKMEAVKMGEHGYKLVKDITWEGTISTILGDTGNLAQSIISRPARKKITVASHFSIYPPRGGGQSRIFNLYKHVANEFDVEVVCMGNNNERELGREISRGLVETVVPKTIAQAEKECEYEKEVGIPVSDSALPLVSHLTPGYGIKLKNSINESDIIIVSHPYLLHEVEKHRGNRPLIYEAQDIEYNLKKVVYKNNNKTTKDILNLIYKLEREACLKSKFILTCSEEDKHTLGTMYDVPVEKFIVAPNGVDCKAIKFVSQDKRVDNKQKVGLGEEYTAIFIGSWHPPNIEACSHIINIAKKIPQVKFLIIGSVCHALMDCKLPQNVGLMGVVSEEEKKLIYSVADVALNPMTSGSGTNLKMFDYMAAGIPVITTEFGARGMSSDDIKHVYISDVEKTHDILNNLYNNVYNEFDIKVANARKVIEEKFDWEVICKKVVDALTNVF
jgi:glycosyltransferase involved in cell wall biosynthesis